MAEQAKRGRGRPRKTLEELKLNGSYNPAYHGEELASLLVELTPEQIEELQAYDPIEQINRYINGVLDGDVITGEYVRSACRRHVDDLAHGEARGLWFDESKAAAACRFFPEYLRHSVGQWHNLPFYLSDNQAFIIGLIFGWQTEDDDGTAIRRFRDCYITCARKWGKSAMASGIGLMMLTGDQPPEPSARVYCTATKKDQALLVWDAARDMVLRSEPLSPILDAKHNAIVTTTASRQPSSTMKAVGSDKDTADGHNPTCIILDELHAWQARHERFYDRMVTAAGSRRQPLSVTITTAGDDNSELWKARDAEACRMLEAAERGEHINDTLFAFVARLDAEDDPWDEANWTKANPNYPVTPRPRDLRDKAKKWRGHPSDERRFVRFHCNRQVAATERAIGTKLWDEAAGELSDWSSADFIGGGVDHGGYVDLASAAQCARFEIGCDKKGEIIYRYEVRSRSWMVATTDRKLDLEPFYSWIENGLIEVVDDPVREIKAYIAGESAEQWAYDAAGASQFGQELAAEYGDEFAFRMPQVYLHYDEPIRRFQAALKDGRVTHDGDPVLSWAVGNFQVKSDNNDRLMPCKKASQDKIDPIVAVLMAFRCALYAESNKPAIY